MKFNAQNPLPYQVIVVDEASMVDLSLFAGLMEAVSPNCRIILLGDMHQLPSVEAGAVLGDLTARFLSREGFPTLTNKMAAWVENVLIGVDIDKIAEERFSSLALPSDGEIRKAGALIDHAVILTHSYRPGGAWYPGTLFVYQPGKSLTRPLRSFKKAAIRIHYKWRPKTKKKKSCAG